MAGLAASVGLLGAPAVTRARDRRAASSPHRNFDISGTFLNAAYTHPMPLDTAAAVRKFLARRCNPSLPHEERNATALFAQLTNATPAEIAAIPSTSYGENLVAGALGLFEDRSARIVTDVLHFDGSLYMYGELAKKGNPVTVLPVTTDGRIDMNRLEQAVVPGTRLVAISLVSKVNGFQHDLKTVCDIAHRRGAKVYVDAIQGAGAVPIDVKAAGVDFMACSTFKWLMGDFGYGFLYVREDLLPQLKRAQYGYNQVDSYTYHVFPGDPPGGLFTATPISNQAAGFFEVGTTGIAAEVAAGASLQMLLGMGVANIQRTRQPLMDRLYQMLSDRYRPLTPKGSTSPIITFALKGADKKLERRLKAAHIDISLYENRFRISPSIYNGMQDIDRLIDVLLA